MHDIEAELVIEQKHHQDTIKEMSRSDRRMKELAYQSEEDKKNNARLQKIIEKLESKIKALRRQIDESEEIANVNLHKYRHAQQELENAFERADIAENQVAKFRAANRSSSIAPRACSPQVTYQYNF